MVFLGNFSLSVLCLSELIVIAVPMIADPHIASKCLLTVLFGSLNQNPVCLLRVVPARLVAAYISDWCKTGTGQKKTFSTNKNGDQRINEGRRSSETQEPPAQAI